MRPYDMSDVLAVVQVKLLILKRFAISFEDRGSSLRRIRRIFDCLSDRTIGGKGIPLFKHGMVPRALLF